jgi:hypothetical protein
MVAMSQDASAMDSFRIVFPPTVAVAGDANGYTLTADGQTTIGVDATVADSDGWADVRSVTACLYADGGDPTCAKPDPISNVSMAYRVADGSFAVAAGGSSWWHDAGSHVVSKDSFTDVVHFSFGVSPVAAPGQWHVRVTAADQLGNATNGGACTVTAASCFTPVFSRYVSINANAADASAGSISALGAGRIVANVPVSLRVGVAPGPNPAQTAASGVVVCGAGVQRGASVAFAVPATGEAGVANPTANCHVAPSSVSGAWLQATNSQSLAITTVT